jgi:hypothetical protein
MPCDNVVISVCHGFLHWPCFLDLPAVHASFCAEYASLSWSADVQIMKTTFLDQAMETYSRVKATCKNISWQILLWDVNCSQQTAVEHKDVRDAVVFG